MEMRAFSLWKCAHFPMEMRAFSPNLHKMHAFSLKMCAFSGKCTCILCKLGENACILLKMRAFSKFEHFEV